MTPSARDANLNEGALSRLCKAIQDDIDNGRMFGTSIIVARGGKIGLQKVFGTVTLMAELLATMTSTSQCRFTLDTKVAEILPEFGVGGNSRQLLNHTAGTFRGFLPPGISVENLGNLDQHYASVASIPIEYVPGTQCVYNPFASYAVLGKILVATDPKERNFRTISKEELFDPLGMGHSCFGLAEDHANRVPVCHTSKQTNTSTPSTQHMLTKGCTNGNEMPAASAFCTIHDLFRFVEAMRQRGVIGDYRLMSKALFDYACKNHTVSLSNSALVPEKEPRNIPDSPALYSLLGGYVRGEGHYLTSAGYTASPRAFYSVGGGSTMWMVDPDRDLSVCFLSAGFIEGLHHLERLSKINDLALASCD
ncbi:Beta-lactamase domain-containing protein [Fusarium keratoplasticum]|uniref:Beta-lactamase domain-containing protein n=1 Tax=Fusarium keratoplasticum TaxID=1328300 RepID=A0ACC0R8L3_9HYPO|nr:Beta-lactamase domain-containing protein [Fusarium keratoplasticum]KAI8676024.1 Beta-lactamase domain-containing protein [Fusarium keratoplasticum]